MHDANIERIHRLIYQMLIDMKSEPKVNRSTKYSVLTIATNIRWLRIQNLQLTFEAV